jgi:predicted ATPase
VNQSRPPARQKTKPGLVISRLRLENWRNFVHVETDVQQRVFLVGPNASGKSNLLDAFRFLHDIVSVGGGLEEAVRKRMGMSRLRSLAARRQPEVVIEVALRHATSGTQWEYELSLTQGKDQRPRIKHERIVKDGKVLVNRPDDKDTQDPERLTQTYLQQVNVNRDFREVADFFAAIRYLHIVPQLVHERWRCHWRARS